MMGEEVLGYTSTLQYPLRLYEVCRSAATPRAHPAGPVQ